MNSVNEFCEFVKRKIFDFEDFLFEKLHGLDLSGVITNDNLVANNINSLAHATAYHAVWCRNLRILFKETNNVGYNLENFIDIGSGKGKACFYADLKGRFRKVLGIEFSIPLLAIVEENKIILKNENIKFLNADAAEFILPNCDNFIFMFNPFDNVVLDKFIKNNIEHFEKK